MTIEDIILLIDTLALFFQGFFIARRNKSGFIISSLIIFSISVWSMIIKGIYVFGDALSRAGPYELIFGFSYAIFFWGLGFFIGHFTIIREKDLKNMVKIVKIKTK